MASFEVLWQNACAEEPDPKGAAGHLMAALAGLLDAAQVEHEKLEAGAVFLVDLSFLGVRGMDFNVVMISHPPKTEDDESRQAGQLLEYRMVVKSDGLCFHIVLSDNPPDVGSDALIPSSVRVYGPDLQRLFASPVPASVLLGIIRRQVPLQRLCPFNTTRVARGAMFRGRRDELADLTQDLQTNFVISGARRIGKTSLLTRCYDNLRTRPEYRDRVHLFNCIPWGNVNDCFHRLAHELEPKGELRISYGPRATSHQYLPRNISYLLQSHSRRGARPLLLFFDELDRVVETDARNGWPFFKVLAEAADQQWIRAVFAGYRSMGLLSSGKTVREPALATPAPDSPFFGRLKELELRPLGRQECDTLVAEPFHRMEITVERRDAIQERIWQQTLGHPFFVQLYGEGLFETGSRRTAGAVGLEDVDAIEQGASLNKFVHEYFLENTIQKGQPVATEQLCTLLLADEDDGQTWAEADFLQALAAAKRPAGLLEVHQALSYLRSAGIFAYQNGGYRFALPLLKDVLRRAYPNIQAVLPSV